MLRRLRAGLVRLGFSVQMAARGLLTNPLRSSLTVLSVVIGVAAVISLMGIGEGARRSITAQFASLGENVVIVETLDSSVRFRPDLGQELLQRVSTLQYATPVITTDAPVRWRRARGRLQVLGVNEQFPLIRDHAVVAGHFFTDLHLSQRSRVAVLGYRLATRLLGGRSPVGNTITIDGRSFRIIGVLAAKGRGRAGGIDEQIAIPYTVAQQVARQRTADQIWAKAGSAHEADLAVAQLGRIFRREMGIAPQAPAPEEGSGEPGGPGGEPGGPGTEPGREGATGRSGDATVVEPPSGESSYTEVGGATLGDAEELVAVTNLNQMVKEADRANRVMTLMLGGIAAVSLLVGGIGIMNIMLVSVSERTSEIGLRKALGARRGDLLTQFLIEALFLSAAGGLVGLLLGYGGASLITRYGLETAVTPTASAVALVAALVVGLVFGVYPAWVASGLQPVEALRRQ